MSIISCLAIILIMGWALLPTIDYIDWMKMRKTSTVRFPLTGEKLETLHKIKVFANSHYVTPKPTLRNAIKNIKKDLNWLGIFWENIDRQSLRIDKYNNALNKLFEILLLKN